MWILPKQLRTSASALDTKALGLDSEEFSQVCERSLTWRGKDSLSRTWLQRWKRESWMQHLCTRTLKPSLTESFVDAWTSSLADSRVSHSQLLESVTALKILDTCSHTSQPELESANLELFSSKTSKELSQPRQQTGNQFSSMSSESWKAWVTEQRQEYSVRLKLARHIRESGSTSWPTATTRDWKDTTSTVPPSRANPSKQTLGQRVAHVGLLDQANPSTTGKIQGSQQWPTATARDWKGCGNATTRKDGKHRIDNLEAVIKYGLLDQANPSTTGKSQGSWSTPQARYWKGPEGRAYKGQTKDLPSQTEAQGKLNPDWVESLMGLPVGWTDLGSWAME